MVVGDLAGVCAGEGPWLQVPSMQLGDHRERRQGRACLGAASGGPSKAEIANL